MFQSNLPKVYWSYAVQHAVFLINRIPTRVLNDKSPSEVLYGLVNLLIYLSQLKVFGVCVIPPQYHLTDISLIRRQRKVCFLVTSREPKDMSQ